MSEEENRINKAIEYIENEVKFEGKYVYTSYLPKHFEEIEKILKGEISYE